MISIINAEWVLYTVFEDLHDYKCAGERAIICVSRSLPGDKCCSSVLFSSESSLIRKYHYSGVPYLILTWYQVES